MKRFVAILAVVFILGVLLKGSITHLLLVLGVGLWLGVPYLLFMLCWLIYGLKKNKEIPKNMKAVFWGPMSVAIAFVLAYPVGRFINNQEIKSVKKYVSELVSKLDDYRKMNGVFPSSLNDLGIKRPPFFFRGRGTYEGEIDAISILL